MRTTLLSRVTAKIVESWQPKASALDRAKTRLEQAKEQKEEGKKRRRIGEPDFKLKLLSKRILKVACK